MAINVHNSIPYQVINIPSPIEVVATEIYLEACRVGICNLYLPPDYPNHSQLNNIILSLTMPYVITPDANAHHPLWGSSQRER